MSEIQSVDPEQARQLLGDGWVYVDVRTEKEFEEGHVPGALNVPLMLPGQGGMTPNPEFVGVMRAQFDAGTRIVVGCRTGVRSRRAAEILRGEGFTVLADLVTGWEGTRDAFGRTLPGWRKLGLPIETGATAGARYADVKARAR